MARDGIAFLVENEDDLPVGGDCELEDVVAELPWKPAQRRLVHGERGAAVVSVVIVACLSELSWMTGARRYMCRRLC